MPETVGLLILSATGIGGGVGIAGLGTVAGTTIAGVGLATIVGSAALIGAAIGLQYALTPNPQLPKPQDGAQALRQAIPPRQRGYGRNRLAGYYMFFEADSPPSVSYDIVAFHSGKVESLIGFYLSDDAVTTTPSVLAGGAGSVDELPGGAYDDGCSIQTRLGEENPDPITGFNALWNTSTQFGKGIAFAAIGCTAPGDPESYTNRFPRGRPEFSAVAHCSPVWDPRDGSQIESDPTTWKSSRNPVIQLLDYITREDGGLGQERSIAVPDGAVLAAWLAEAWLCDTVVVDRERYISDGWYRYDTSPEDVINSILSTCDGWLSESGDGSLSLVVGVYREPTDPPITAADILGFSLNCGQPDEQIVNVFNVSFTDPEQKFVERQLADYRDEASISETGVARPRPLSLTWVQNESQAEMLAGRAMSRVNPRRSGTLTLKLVGMRYLGKRWVKLQYPFLSDLEDCVIEIQPAPKIDLLRGQVTFSWNLVDTAALLALQ